MPNDFDNWDSDSVSGGIGNTSGAGFRPGSGGWHWLQTLIAIVIVFLLSMFCAYMTRTVEERPVWMMGLIFMVPTAALMAATILVEKNTSAMTPASSRKPQFILAITATVLTFFVACICDLIYLYGFKKPLTPSMAVNVPYETSDRLLIVTDPTYSMAESSAGAEAAGISASILDHCAPGWEAGLVSGDVRIQFSDLSQGHKKNLLKEINKTPDQGRMYYEDVLTAALEMAEKSGSDRPTRILLLTDGRHAWSKNGDSDLSDRCLRANVTVSCVQLGSGTDPMLLSLIRSTGGKLLDRGNALTILDGMESTRYTSTVFPASVEEKLKLDLLRNREPSAILICAVMLLLEGLSLGICISLMLSLKGQFRLQYILTPVMGVLAFVLLKFIWDNNDITTTWWIKEGLAFSLLGIVVMKKNRSGGAGRVSAGTSAVAVNDDWDQ
ncbi:MAG: VWA domain-containing protein [Clostridia bacterium]|nr:VWA domain-containing protein [Clostridia bacterium]